MNHSPRAQLGRAGAKRTSLAEPEGRSIWPAGLSWAPWATSRLEMTGREPRGLRSGNRVGCESVGPHWPASETPRAGWHGLRTQGPLSLQKGLLPAFGGGVERKVRGEEEDGGVPDGGVHRAPRWSLSWQGSPWCGPRQPSGSQEGSEAGRLGSEKWDRQRVLASSLTFLGHRGKVKDIVHPGQSSRQKSGLEAGHPGDQAPQQEGTPEVRAGSLGFSLLDRGPGGHGLDRLPRVLAQAP